MTTKKKDIDNTIDCAGFFAVSPFPAHQNPGADSEGNLPPIGDPRPGPSKPKCEDKSLYGPECTGCCWEMKCEYEEKELRKELMDHIYPNGYEKPKTKRTKTADIVQIWNPKGVWVLINRDIGQIISHSPSKFLNIPVVESIQKEEIK